MLFLSNCCKDSVVQRWLVDAIKPLLLLIEEQLPPRAFHQAIPQYRGISPCLRLGYRPSGVEAS